MSKIEHEFNKQFITIKLLPNINKTVEDFYDYVKPGDVRQFVSNAMSEQMEDMVNAIEKIMDNVSHNEDSEYDFDVYEGLKLVRQIIGGKENGK